MSIKNLVEMIKHNGLLASISQLEELYRVAIDNEQKLADSEAKCAALAAENAGLKESRKNLAEFIHEELDADYPLNMDIETPATDAFLAEVRNEAGARAVELFAQTLGSPYAVRDEKCYEDGFTRAIEIVRGAQAPRFAAQLRKGGAA